MLQRATFPPEYQMVRTGHPLEHRGKDASGEGQSDSGNTPANAKSSPISKQAINHIREWDAFGFCVLLCACGCQHHRGACGRGSGLQHRWTARLVHLLPDLGKQLAYQGFLFGQRLHDGTAPLLSQRLARTIQHVTLTLQVHLLAHRDPGHALVPLHAGYLVSPRLDVLEAW